MSNALYRERPEMLVALLEAGGNPNATYGNNQSLLAEAALRGSLEIVQALVKHGASVDSDEEVDCVLHLRECSHGTVLLKFDALRLY